ncbi:hypothetical protein BDV59DRAFT_195423 [Aspergillus ambiguus]|uniref:Pfs, NB-ARC and Ankyrin domain protein n=1 Tax=Aspergillus ambiguus TaxID=176160 RepID=UPI003CCE521D
MSAVRFMLDKEHRSLPPAPGDTNLYILGELSSHNVVIAFLPGNQGKGAAAIVTTYMARTFPGIDLRLLVGIGGGVPSNKHDIRLGDVVVSMPDGPHGGVIQYDLGKDTDGGFDLKGHLLPSPSTLRSAAIRMRSDHRVKPSKTNEFLLAMLQKGSCNDCDERKAIHRPPRATDSPHIHYGLIASGDRVMRSGRKRYLASQPLGDVLCFEMEAAGILAEFPCLVIRAASCAKELLLYLDPRRSPVRDEIDGTSYPLCEYSHGIKEPSTKRRADRLSQSPTEEQKKRLLGSLKFDQIDVRKLTIKTAHSKTCKWLLRTPEYILWLDDTKICDHNGVLWIKGKPGAGKSTLMKFAFNSWKSRKGKIILSFFFNARGNDLEKSTIGIVPELVALFDSLERTVWDMDEPQWSLDVLQDLFRQAIHSLGQSSVIRDMLHFFSELGETAINARARFLVLLSSRHYPHITVDKGLELDISDYVDSELKIGHGNGARQIREELQAKASGVFMWVFLVVQILNKEHDRGRVRTLRRKLQEIPGDLHDLFRDILERDGENRDELLLCVQWLYCALLSNDESAYLEKYILDCSKGLAEVTHSKSPTVQFIHESVRDFLLKENGFAEIWPDVGSNFQGLSHERLKQYILDLTEPFPTASSQEMATIRQSATGAFPFLKYATCNVLYHADIAEENRLSRWNTLNNLFERYEVRRHTPHVSLLYILSEYDLSNLIEASPFDATWLKVEKERYGPPLFAALANESNKAFQVFLRHHEINRSNSGHDTTVRLLLADPQVDPDARDEYGRTPLSRAAKSGHARDKHGQTPLLWAASHGFKTIARLLLADPRVDPNARDKYGQTPLSWAAKSGRDTTVRLLLADQRVDPDARDEDRRTPLSFAAYRGSETIARLLLADPRVDPNNEDEHGRPPLWYATENGYKSVARLLLADQRIDPNIPTTD